MLLPLLMLPSLLLPLMAECRAQLKVLHPHAVPILPLNLEDVNLDLEGLKRDGIPTLMSDSEGLPDEDTKNRNLVVYYSFETFFPKTQKIKDESSFDNNGILGVGGIILKIPGSSCRSAAYLWDQSIKVSFSTPDGAPKYGISIAMWVKFQVFRHVRKIFESKGIRFGIMTLMMHDDNIIFSYRPCSKCPDYFKVVAQTTVKREWFHLVATYNALTGIAQLYVDGWPLNRTWNKDATPFHYWGADVRIGASGSQGSLKAFIDEVRIYNHDLSSQEVGFLSLSCSFSESTPANMASRSDIDVISTPTASSFDSSDTHSKLADTSLVRAVS